MATVAEVKPTIRCFEFKQEKSDKDYGNCTWARFYLDTEKYTMNIESECGNFRSSWVPTPDTESFIKLCSRFDSGYLLERFSNGYIIDKRKTYDNVIKLLKEDYSIHYNKMNDWDFEKIRSACNNSNLNYVHENLIKTLQMVDCYDLFNCIKEDYPVGVKRIVEIYINFIEPYLKKLIEKENK